MVTLPLIILVTDDGQQRGPALYHMPCTTVGPSTTSLILLLLSQMCARKGMQKFSSGSDQS